MPPHRVLSSRGVAYKLVEGDEGHLNTELLPEVRLTGTLARFGHLYGSLASTMAFCPKA